MKTFSFTKALTLACLVGLSLPIACGDDDDDAPVGTAGTAGTAGKGRGEAGAAGATNSGEGGTAAMLPPGLSDMPSTEECGANACESAKAGPIFIDPCCATDGSCGLSTGFLALVGARFDDACQPLHQPGAEDAACPAATGLKVPYQSGPTTLMLPLTAFPGCCRENGTCGVVVDQAVSPGVLTADLGLGCVDAAPFFPGQAIVKCGDSGGAGSGGAGSGGTGSGGEGGSSLAPEGGTAAGGAAGANP